MSWTMARKPKFTVEIIAEALRNSGGIYTTAASLIEAATKESCAANTVANYVKRSKTLQKLLEEIENENFDLAVHGLLQQIREQNLTAIIYYINRKGGKFGWSNKVEIEATIKNAEEQAHLKNLEALDPGDQRKILAIIERVQAQQEDDGDPS